MTNLVLFKGTRKEYQALHGWVKKHLGKPMECENCGTTEANRFDWANISGEYKKDLSDWARLCSMCHLLVDGRKPYNNPNEAWTTACKRGHVRTEENTRWRIQRGNKFRACIDCDRVHIRNHWRKVAAATPNRLLIERIVDE